MIQRLAASLLLVLASGIAGCVSTTGGDGQYSGYDFGGIDPPYARAPASGGYWSVDPWYSQPYGPAYGYGYYGYAYGPGWPALYPPGYAPGYWPGYWPGYTRPPIVVPPPEPRPRHPTITPPKHQLHEPVRGTPSSTQAPVQVPYRPAPPAASPPAPAPVEQQPGHTYGKPRGKAQPQPTNDD